LQSTRQERRLPHEPLPGAAFFHLIFRHLARMRHGYRNRSAMNCEGHFINFPCSLALPAISRSVSLSGENLHNEPSLRQARGFAKQTRNAPER